MIVSKYHYLCYFDANKAQLAIDKHPSNTSQVKSDAFACALHALGLPIINLLE